jgi:hypothetical protein
VIGIKHALPGPEDVACLASNGVTHEFAAAPELVSELRYPRSAGIVHPQLGSRRPYGGFQAFSSVVRQVPTGAFLTSRRVLDDEFVLGDVLLHSSRTAHSLKKIIQ